MVQLAAEYSKLPKIIGNKDMITNTNKNKRTLISIFIVKPLLWYDVMSPALHPKLY